MKIVKAGYEILTPLNGEDILRKLESIARVCYKSEGKICDGSAEKLVKALVKSNHEAMLEHFSFSVKFICDRGVSHELVRHRVASFAQESTRYCNYGKSGDVVFIDPTDMWKNLEEDKAKLLEYYWSVTMEQVERSYFMMLKAGASPQEARTVLPNSLKTEVVMTANLREWRHFFELRALGTTGKPHPQIQDIAVRLLEDVRSQIPVVFDDLV